jgi:hypothetical protein
VIAMIERFSESKLQHDYTSIADAIDIRFGIVVVLKRSGD